MRETFLRCEHVSGLELWAWLTYEQIYASDDCWCDGRVWAYEDRAGEMVPHDVRVADLEVLEEA